MLSKNSSRHLNGNKLALFLAIRFILLAFYIIYYAPTLAPDEAQYWTWSQDLSLGYYSKPPGIAWQIFTTTSLFGNTEWGIRSSALILGTLSCFAIYWLAKEVYKSEKIAFWSAIFFSLTPLNLMGSVFAITDGGMILCWMLALLFYLRNKTLLFGVFLSLGALFKWPIYILPVALLISEPKNFMQIVKGVLISLFGFIPTLYWNFSHNFVTFRHVGTTLKGGHYGNRGNPLDFIGAQIALLSPFLFVFSCASFLKPATSRNERVLKVVTAIFVIPLILSFFMKMQGNWADFVLPSALILGINWILEKKTGSIWMGIGMAFSLLISTVIGANILPYPSNPLKNSLGYDRITSILKDNGYDASKDYLVSDSYQVTSLLSFYGPAQDRAYFLNVGHRRLNQFSFWAPLKEDARKEGYFMVTSDSRKLNPDAAQKQQEKIEPYFSKVSYVGTFQLVEQNGKEQKVALLYHVEGYTKEEPGHGGLF